MCYAQNKYFADLYNVTIVYVSRWVSHLQQLGYIKTEIIRNENKEINSNKISKEFLAIIDRLEFNYKPYMIEHMKQDKINNDKSKTRSKR